LSSYLQLTQDLRAETTDSGTGPATVVGNTGEHARFCKWIKDAYSHLQLEREDWKWLRRQFTVNTVAGTDSYAYASCTDSTEAAPISRFARWYQGSDINGFPYFTAYLTSTGVGAEYPLIWLEYDLFRRLYKFGTQNNVQPVHYSVSPDRNFMLGPKPDAIYTISGTYQRSPQTLAVDDDIPEMPEHYHPIIVYEAMSRYGGSRAAPEAIMRANSEGGRLRAMLELDQLPALSYGAPLA
jgi:hypothetical protein